jgi:hypothetical protein
MSESDKAQLLMLCGALKDISEDCKDKIAASQINDVLVKIENIVLLSLIDNS